MKTIDIQQELENNSYPGRGIILGRSADNENAVIAYWIMGRSANSRNRVFTETEDGIQTEAFDASKLEDPSLIIYHPVRCLEDGTIIVTNGDQTNTIYDAIQQGGSFESGLRTRTFEDDGPNWTPRISGIVNAHSGAYKLSILKSADGNGDSVQRYFFEYGQPVAGEGHFISTYKCNGSPIPSFEGEPLRVAMPDSVTAFAQMLWASLNEDNKVSLFVRCIDLESGRAGDILYNNYSEVE